jgi:hypothetical protein
LSVQPGSEEDTARNKKNVEAKKKKKKEEKKRSSGGTLGAPWGCLGDALEWCAGIDEQALL